MNTTLKSNVLSIMDYDEHSVPITEDRVCTGFLNNNYLLITRHSSNLVSHDNKREMHETMNMTGSKLQHDSTMT